MHNSLVASDIGERISGVVSALCGIITGAATTVTFAAGHDVVACARRLLPRIDRQRVADRHDEGGDQRRKDENSISFPHCPVSFSSRLRPGSARQRRQADRQLLPSDTSSDVPRRFRCVAVTLPGRHASVTSRFRTACGDRAVRSLFHHADYDGTSFHKLGQAKPLKRLCYAHR